MPKNSGKSRQRKQKPITIDVGGKTYTFAGIVETRSQVKLIPFTVESYVRDVISGEIDRDTLIQREPDQWSTYTKSMLIYAMLMDRQIGNILIAKGRDESKNYEIDSLIDGLQRTTAIVGYVNGEFSLSKKIPAINCRFKDEEENSIEVPYEIGGKKFDKLPSVLQKSLLRYRLTVYEYVDFEDEELDEIDKCVNSGKSPTVYQKMRFTLGSDNMRMLQPLCDSTLWEDIPNVKAKNDSILACVIRTAMLNTRYAFNNLGAGQMNEFVSHFGENVTLSKIRETGELIEQLAEIKCGMSDDDIEIFSGCSIPHIVMNLKRYNSIGENSVSYGEFLHDFFLSDEYQKFCDTEETGSGGSQYSLENVSERQAIIDDYLDSYFENSENTEGEGDDRKGTETTSGRTENSYSGRDGTNGGTDRTGAYDDISMQGYIGAYGQTPENFEFGENYPAQILYRDVSAPRTST